MHRDRLDARLELVDVIKVAKDQRDKDHPTSGFGRLDAFDGTRNFLFTRLRKTDADGKFKVDQRSSSTRRMETPAAVVAQSVAADDREALR